MFPQLNKSRAGIIMLNIFIRFFEVLCLPLRVIYEPEPNNKGAPYAFPPDCGRKHISNAEPTNGHRLRGTGHPAAENHQREVGKVTSAVPHCVYPPPVSH